MTKPEKLSDIARKLVTTKGVARDKFEMSCAAMRRRINRNIRDGQIQTSVRKDPDGHLLVADPKAVYQWARGIRGYEEAYVEPVTLQGSADFSAGGSTLSASPVLSATAEAEYIDRINALEATVNRLQVELERCRSQQAKGALYGKKGGRPKKMSEDI